MPRYSATAHHQAGDEHGDHGQDQHAVQAGAGPPGATSPSCMLNSVIMPPRLVYESWNESTAPVDVSVVASANTAEFGNAEALFDTFHRRTHRRRDGTVVLSWNSIISDDADRWRARP